MKREEREKKNWGGERGMKRDSFFHLFCKTHNLSNFGHLNRSKSRTKSVKCRGNFKI